MSDVAAPTELPFDQYQRYRLVADVLDRVRAARGGGPLRILDVGGRTALLRRFLPEDRVDLVDVEPSEEAGLVLGDGSRLPFLDGAFDAVATFDTLEHVPPAGREAFLAECRRVSRGWVVVAGPYDTPRVAEAERELKAFLTGKLETRHRYLEEHASNGLPDLVRTEARLRELGGRVVSVPHGNVERWLALMCVSLYLDRDAPLRSIAKRFHRFYNEAVYARDVESPVYRHAVVACYDGGDPASVVPRFECAPGAIGALEPVRRFAEELLAIDGKRDVWTPEWNRLTEVNEGLVADLAGHRARMAELEERHAEQASALADLREDLGGHRTRVRDLARELEEVRSAAARSRAEAEETERELRDEIGAHQASFAKARAELEALASESEREHRSWDEAQARVRAEREEFECVRTELTGNLAASEEVRAALARQIEERLAYEDSLVAELGRTNEAAAQIQTELRAALSGIEELRLALGAREAELSSAHAELSSTQAELSSARAALEVALSERDDARSRIDDLREQLHSRLGNLRRALAPRKPQP